jgi:hypothetical protein
MPTLLEQGIFMAPFEMSVEMPAKRQKTGEGCAYDEPSRELEELITPSGRKLRDVQGWANSGVPLSTLSDKAALLLDMAAEQILCLFGDPYGMHQMLSDPPHCLHVHPSQLCLQILDPPHSLRLLLIRLLSQMLDPRHSLQHSISQLHV